jgi:FAD binding domain
VPRCMHETAYNNAAAITTQSSSTRQIAHAVRDRSIWLCSLCAWRPCAGHLSGWRCTAGRATPARLASCDALEQPAKLPIRRRHHVCCAGRQLLSDGPAGEARSSCRHIFAHAQRFEKKSLDKQLFVLEATDESEAVLMQVWNLRVTASPALVAYPKSTPHVSNVVKCARQSGLKVVPRSGAHSYE